MKWGFFVEMTDSKRDENRVTTLIGVDKDDLETPTPIAVNPDSDGAGTPGLIVEVAE